MCHIDAAIFSLYNVAMAIEHGIEALRDCEVRLCRLAAEAVAGSDYEAAIQLTKLAKSIAALTPGGPINTDDAEDNVRGESQESPRQRRKRSRRSQRSKRPAARGYPRFARQRGDLIKVGWSRKEKNEYHHRAPREFVELLRDRLDQVGASGDLFTTDDLFPLETSEDSEVPSYQAYLCLAWFRELGLVEQVGRQGYRLDTTVDLRESVEKGWAQLTMGTEA